VNFTAFFILAYVAVSLQAGLSPLVRIGSVGATGAEPNFGLVVVVFVALNAQRQAAPLGAFVVGALQDLATQQPLGLFAFSYGLAGLAIASGSRSVYRAHPLTHFFFALLAGLLTAAVVLIHGRVRHSSAGAAASFSGAIYTAILAPLLIAGLQRFKGLLAFRK
jgi:rod shape-determining protein MreD